MADGQYQKKADYDECVYIEDYEAKTKEQALTSLQKLNEYIAQGTAEEILRQAKEKLAKGEEITEDWLRQARVDTAIVKKVLPIKDYKLSKSIQDGLSGLLYNVVLNKQQYA